MPPWVPADKEAKCVTTRTLKTSLKRLQINLANWEDLAKDQPTWERTVKTGVMIYEANRMTAAKAQREVRRSQLRPPRNPNTQSPPTCPDRQRAFRAPIGLVGYLLTNCSTRITAATVLLSNPASFSTPTTNDDRNPEPLLPSPHSPRALTSATAAPVPNTPAYNPDTPTGINLPTVNTSSAESIPTCPHCDRTFTSHIDHLRIHRTDTGELVPGARTYTRRIRLRCLHCLRTLISRKGLFSHMFIHESRIGRSFDTPSTSCTSTMLCLTHNPPPRTSTTTSPITLSTSCTPTKPDPTHTPSPSVSTVS
nr:unnamed protein product [Spirometra erinaceieuropaei]